MSHNTHLLHISYDDTTSNKNESFNLRREEQTQVQRKQIKSNKAKTHIATKMKSFSLAAKAIPTNGSTERNNSTETMRSLRNLECDDGGGSGDTTTSTSDYFLLASSRTNHAFVQSTSTLKSRITNNYETMEPGFEKGTTNTVKRITSLTRFSSYLLILVLYGKK